MTHRRLFPYASLLFLGLFLLSVLPALAQIGVATAKPRRPEWWTVKTLGPLLTLQQFDTTSGRTILELRDAAGDLLWSTDILGNSKQSGYVQPGSYATGSLPAVTASQAGAIAFDSTTNYLKFVNNSGAWTAIGGGAGSTDTLEDVTGRGATTDHDLTTHKIIPAANTTYDLGASGARWNNVYAATANLSTAILAPLYEYASDTTRNLRWGTGSPNGVVTASVGSIYLDTAGGAGTTLYIKETGTGNTGWVAYNSAGGGGGYIDTDTLASVTARGASTTVSMSTGDVVPSAADTYDLGKTGNRYANLWADSVMGTAASFPTSVFSNKFTGGGDTNTAIYFSNGSPEGAVTADPGSIDLNQAGGTRTSAWVKESGTGNTGWAGIGTASDTLQTITDRGATTTDNLTLSGIVTTGDLLPSANGTKRLGETTQQWGTLFSLVGTFTNVNSGAYTYSDALRAIKWGAGSPNGVVSSYPGSLYLNTAGGAGTTLYIKESGVSSNTGWVAYGATGSDTLQNVTTRGATTTNDLTLHNITPAANNTYASGSLSNRWSSVDTVNVDAQTATASTSVTTGKIVSGADPNVTLTWGTGSPNGVVSASPGAIYFNRSGGASTTLYVKESGTATNTGWVAYSASGGGGGGGLVSPGASTLLRTDGTGALAATTIGTGLSFDGTTLSATGGGTSTNSDTLDTVTGRGNTTSHGIVIQSGIVNPFQVLTTTGSNLLTASSTNNLVQAATILPNDGSRALGNPAANQTWQTVYAQNLYNSQGALTLTSGGSGRVVLNGQAGGGIEMDVPASSIALSGIVTGGAQGLPASPTEYLKVYIDRVGGTPTPLYIPLFAGP